MLIPHHNNYRTNNKAEPLCFDIYILPPSERFE